MCEGAITLFLLLFLLQFFLEQNVGALHYGSDMQFICSFVITDTQTHRHTYLRA